MATKKTGITLAAEGEKEFRKAISDINRDMSAMRAEMSIVAAEFAGNEKSMEALTAKGKVLRDTYDMQSEKLEVMREALAKIKSGYGENSDKAKDWEVKLKRQEAALAKTKAEIIKNNTAMEEAAKAEEDMSNGFENLSKNADKAGESTLKMSDLLKANLLSDAITKGLQLLKSGFQDILNTMQSMEGGYDTIVKKTGATGEALTELNATAEEVFSEMPVEFADAGNAIGEVNTRFKSTGDELKDLSEIFLKFADINDTDVSNAIDQTDKIMKQFNIESGKAGDVLGIFTKAAQDTGESVDSLMGEVQSNGATFKEMGLSIEQTVNLLAQCSSNGVNTDTAIAGLRKSVQEFAKQGMSAEEGLNAVINSIKNAKSETDALNMSYEVFGRKGGAEMASAIREGRFSVEDMSSAMQNYGSIVDETYQNTMHVGDDVKVMQNNIDLAVNDLGQTLATTFGDDFLNVLEIIKGFLGYVKDNKDKVVTTVAAIGAGFVTWKVATMISGVVSAIKAFQLANEGASVAQALLNGVMMSNPMVLIATLIAALVAGLAVFILKNENAREKVGQAWDWIKEKVSGAVDWCKEKFDFIVNFFKDNWQGILLFLMNPFAGAFKLLYDNCDAFRNFIDKWLGKIGDKFDDALDFLRDLPRNALQWGKDFIDGFVDGISNGIDKVEKAASKVAGKVRSFLHFSVPDEGPLADADEYGSDFVDLYAGGITDNINKIEQAASKMSLGIKNNMNPEMKNITRGDTIISSSMKDMQLVANIEVGGKKVANVMTPLIIKQMNRDNRNKEVVSGI